MSWLDFIPFSKKQDTFTLRIIEITGIKPKNLEIYRRAFTHKSSGQKDANGYRINYERMEFLGDALLDAVITDYLYHHLPTDSEGELTKMRSKIVSRRHLNEIGKNMGLVRLSKKKKSRRKYSYNAHGDMFEALVAAIYLDRGYDKMKFFIQKKVIDVYVDLDALQKRIQSYKSLMVEWCQKKKKDYVFEVSEDTGNENKTHFVAQLIIEGKVAGKARAISKKKAEEAAAKRAYYKFKKSM